MFFFWLNSYLIVRNLAKLFEPGALKMIPPLFQSNGGQSEEAYTYHTIRKLMPKDARDER
jgi:hypothetical protein